MDNNSLYKTLTVTCGGGTYDVVIGENILKNVGGYAMNVCPTTKTVFIITDDIVRRLYADCVIKSLNAAGVNAVVFEFKNGEASKNHSTLVNIYNAMIDAKITRSDLVVAIGGGVVGDVAAYAAATYTRGIKFIHVPTTLISQADSSLGGKCAVNVGGTKNIVGSFFQPSMVISDTGCLTTLNAREYGSGLAEVIKCACIKDAEFFDTIMAANPGELDLNNAIHRCCEIKKYYIEADELDRNLRHTLNFGHTVGHAIEACSEYALAHGEAVGIGMLVAAKIGEDMGVTKRGVAALLEATLRKYNLPTEIPKGHIPNYRDFIASDKKRHGDYISYVILEDIGRARIVAMDMQELLASECMP